MQDTREVKAYSTIASEWIVDQARTVLEDVNVAAFKIGVLGNNAAVEAVHIILRNYPDIPVIFDPVLRSATDYTFGDEHFVNAITHLLLPLTFLLTPNSLESRTLAPGADNLDACAQEILKYGCRYVLITGTHEATKEVHNILYGNFRKLEVYRWQRLKGSYHGSGCTLASAVAALLAQGFDPLNAVSSAQEYTWNTLANGKRIGMGQLIPDRFFRAPTEKVPKR